MYPVKYYLGLPHPAKIQPKHHLPFRYVIYKQPMLHILRAYTETKKVSAFWMFSLLLNCGSLSSRTKYTSYVCRIFIWPYKDKLFFQIGTHYEYYFFLSSNVRLFPVPSRKKNKKENRSSLSLWYWYLCQYPVILFFIYKLLFYPLHCWDTDILQLGYIPDTISFS